MQKFEFLCPNHITELQNSEHRAMAYWCEMMRRGGKAYSQCRVETSELYFHAAAEICLLRCLCRSNSYFSDLHMKKPLDFLLELFLQNQSYKKANSLLSKVARFFQEDSNNNIRLGEYLESAYKRVEQEEKRFLYERSFDSLDRSVSHHLYAVANIDVERQIH